MDTNITYIKANSLAEIIDPVEDNVYVVDNKLYVCHEGKLTLMETMLPELKLNLYDMNKQIISQLKPMTNKEITQKHKLIMDFYNKCKNNHWILLCRDFNYYTLFEKSDLYNVDFA